MQRPTTTTRQRWHTLLVHVPLLSWLCALLADAVAAATGSAHDLGWYLTAAGTLGVGLVVIAGMLDLGSQANERARRVALSHVTATAVAMFFGVVNLQLRPSRAAMPGGAWFVAACALALLLLGTRLGERFVAEVRAVAARTRASLPARVTTRITTLARHDR